MCICVQYVVSILCGACMCVCEWHVGVWVGEVTSKVWWGGGGGVCVCVCVKIGLWCAWCRRCWCVSVAGGV